MPPIPFRTREVATSALTAREQAIARSVLYASLFDYPLTLAQLRQTLIESRQTPSEILATFRRSASLQELVTYADGYFFPSGQQQLVVERGRREARSRAFLRAHRPLLHLIAALPFVRLVALSGSIAHLNLESGGDLDLFIVTRGTRVWSTAVATVLLAKLLGRRRTLCANFIVADTALTFEPGDLFTASQIINLKPLAGSDTYRRLLDANPYVRRFYPNFHAPDVGTLPLGQPRAVSWMKRAAEWTLAMPSAIAERMCRVAYRAYLRRRSATWQSPEQVRLGDRCLKLHTRSHRATVMLRFDEAVRDALD
jgi:hypothetical protein